MLITCKTGHKKLSIVYESMIEQKTNRAYTYSWADTNKIEYYMYIYL